MEIPYLPISADIVEGDLLTSSGLGGRFPRDYPVAKITQVTKDPTQPYATVTAEPIALLERSREVLLVWPSEKINEAGAVTDLENLSVKPRTSNIPTSSTGAQASVSSGTAASNVEPKPENVGISSTDNEPEASATSNTGEDPASASSNDPDAQTAETSDSEIENTTNQGGE